MSGSILLHDDRVDRTHKQTDIKIRHLKENTLFSLVSYTRSLSRIAFMLIMPRVIVGVLIIWKFIQKVFLDNTNTVILL
jgi:hypothetical protein